MEIFGFNICPSSTNIKGCHFLGGRSEDFAAGGGGGDACFSGGREGNNSRPYKGRSLEFNRAK